MNRSTVRLLVVLSLLSPTFWSRPSHVKADIFCEPDFEFVPAGDKLVAKVPDIAQVREGLPGSGATYCGPTSAADWVRYLARHGYPELVNEGWDDTEVVRQLGSAAYMDTGFSVDADGNVSGGTSPQNLRDGWWRYFDRVYPGCFDVTYRGYQDEDECMTYQQIDDFILSKLAVGAYPIVRVGYYNEKSGARRGGHYMAVVGHSVSEDGTVSLRVNDPSRNTDSTDAYELAERVLGGETRVKLVGRTKTIDGVVHYNYIDGAAVATPRRMLVWEDNSLKLLHVSEPEPPLKITMSSRVAHVIFLPDSLTILGTAEEGSNIVKLDLQTGQQETFATSKNGISSPGALVRDHGGNIWVACGGTLPHSVAVLDAEGRFLKGISRSELPSADDLAYDPIRDRVYAISIALKQIVALTGEQGCRYKADPLSGAVHLAVLPDGRLVYLSDSAPVVNVVTPGSAGCSSTQKALAVPELSRPTSLFTDAAGQIYVTEASKEALFVLDAKGRIRRSLTEWPTHFGRLLGFTEPSRASKFDPFGGDDFISPCELDPNGCEPIRAVEFIRGDANLSSTVDLSDSVATFAYLFLGEDDPVCLDSADTDDSGEIDISDGIFTLGYLFFGGDTIPPPYPNCGSDPTSDELTCAKGTECGEGACIDPQAFSLELELVSRTSETRGRVRFTGTLVHSGPPFRSSPGQQSLRLFEVSAEGHADQVAEREFEDLEPGDTVTVTYERDWNSGMEFPPTVRLQILYDPDIHLDGNEENDDCNLPNNRRERTGGEVNELF